MGRPPAATRRRPTPAAPRAAATAGVIKIVSSLPRTGSANAQTDTIVNGIKMAIDEAGGKVGDFTIEYEDWDDASPQRGNWDPEVEAANANKAVKRPRRDGLHRHLQLRRGQDLDADPQQGRTWLMVSPANTAPGLTKPGKGEPNEPAVYRPTGKVNYFRVVPGRRHPGRGRRPTGPSEMGVKTRLRPRRQRASTARASPTSSSRRAEEIGLEVLGREGIDAQGARSTAR